ncbi:MAG: VirB4 family type IV secretion/conjugal transfer ATPase [Gammaproteobacteria bacterium]
MIAFISLIISVLGVFLLSILFIRIRSVDAELKLKKYRSKDAGLADLLNYASVVDDGVIVGKNGSFLAAWIYRGEDNASSTDEQREAVSARINKALAGLGNGYMIHVDAVRRPSPNYSERNSSYFPDPVTEAIDEERRRLFEGLGTMYEGYFIFTLTYFPAKLAERKFVELMFHEDGEAPNSKERTHNLIEDFKRECLDMESHLSSAVKLDRLRGHKIELEDGTKVTHDDLLRWLQFCVTGLNHPLQLPNDPMYVDSLIGGQELWSGVVPKIGRHFIQVVAIDGFPMSSHPGILNALVELPCSYRWSNRFIFMDTHEALSHLEKFRKKWKQKIRGIFDQVFNTNSGKFDQDAVLMVQDADAAMAELNSGLVAQGYYTSVVVLMDENRDRLDASARQIEKAINALGFTARVETINTMDAYLGSLPGHGVENVRRPLMNTMNLADFLPTSTIWTGRNEAPCPMYLPNSPPLMHCVTNGATPFRLNLHVDDLGHTFLFGPTGAGKSTHLGLLAAQFRRYKDMSIFCFDKGMSMYPIAKASGGKHFTIAADDKNLAFCPLQFLETRGDRAWAMEWIETILVLNGMEVTAVQRNEIATAILNMHKSGSKTLSDFSITVQNQAIREALQAYTVDGAMGHLLDAEEDGLSLTDFTVFEVEELMNLGDKFALPVLLYLFRRIERSLTGQPAVIIIDEAWLMLSHPAFRAKIKEWLKVLRKANCIVLMATQSLSDAVNSGIVDVIIESTATKIFLPNVHATNEDAAPLYRRMGLNERQIKILSTAIPKRHYYYVSDQGRRLYDLALGPLALAFIGNTDKESIKVIKELEEKHGDAWVHEWLRIKGLNLNDYGVAT